MAINFFGFTSGATSKKVERFFQFGRSPFYKMQGLQEYWRLHQPTLLMFTFPSSYLDR